MVFRDTHVLRPSFGQAVVELNGEHDLETKEMLAELLASLIEENDLVVVDISQAEFIDSSVLHNLLKADRLARARGSRFRIQLGTAAIVEKALELSGLLDCLEVVPDRERALDMASDACGVARPPEPRRCGPPPTTDTVNHGVEGIGRVSVRRWDSCHARL